MVKIEVDGLVHVFENERKAIEWLDANAYVLYASVRNTLGIDRAAQEGAGHGRPLSET